MKNQGQTNQEDDNLDENEKRINWNDPEISQRDDTDEPEVVYPEEDPDQAGNIPAKEEIPDDTSIINLYDTNPNASTVHSSNADRTLGNEQLLSKREQNDSDRLRGENE